MRNSGSTQTTDFAQRVAADVCKEYVPSTSQLPLTMTSYRNVIQPDEERFTDPARNEYFFSEEHTIIE
jgi:hypothetical protein